MTKRTIMIFLSVLGSLLALGSVYYFRVILAAKAVAGEEGERQKYFALLRKFVDTELKKWKPAPEYQILNRGETLQHGRGLDPFWLEVQDRMQVNKTNIEEELTRGILWVLLVRMNNTIDGTVIPEQYRLEFRKKYGGGF